MPEQSLFELKWLLLGEWLGNGFIMYRETYDYTGPFSAFVYKFLDIIFGRNPFAHHVFSSLLLIVQATIFNRILLKNKAFDENSYLPAFLYVIVGVTIPDFMSLSPQLMSMTFILMTLGLILRRIDNQSTDELFLNSGIYIGIAAFFYLPAAIFLLVFLFSLIIFSTAVLRRLLLYVFGFSLIVALCCLYYYLKDDIGYFTSYFFINNLFVKSELLFSWREMLFASLPVLIVLIITVSKTVSSASQTNFQQRVQQVIWLMFFGGIICFVLANRKSGAELIFTIPLQAYYLNHYFLLLNRRFFKFIMPAFIVFGSVAYNLFFYQSLLLSEEMKYEWENEKVLVLGENISYYQNKTSATPCFSSHFCEEAFKGLAYYQSATTIYDWLTKLNPDVIVDDLGIIPSLFDRFPLIEQRYRMDLNGNYVKINN